MACQPNHPKTGIGTRSTKPLVSVGCRFLNLVEIEWLVNAPVYPFVLLVVNPTISLTFPTSPPKTSLRDDFLRFGLAVEKDGS